MAESTVPDLAHQTASTEEQTRSEERYVPPAVDIYEDDQGLVLLADMPGVNPSDLDVQADHEVVTIRGATHHLAQGEPFYREFELSGYYRQFRIPREIDTDRITAEMKFGVLTLRLPRSERALPRRIDVVARDSNASREGGES